MVFGESFNDMLSQLDEDTPVYLDVMPNGKSIIYITLITNNGYMYHYTMPMLMLYTFIARDWFPRYFFNNGSSMTYHEDDTYYLHYDLNKGDNKFPYKGTLNDEMFIYQPKGGQKDKRMVEYAQYVRRNEKEEFLSFCKKDTIATKIAQSSIGLQI